MRDEELAKLAERIHQELGEISRVVTRISEGWERARRSNDDFYLDSVALNLQGFYSGLERLFTQIAEVTEGNLPHGENWHQQLLRRMIMEVPTTRPAVISKETGARLDEYRGFRHVARNVYAYKFDPDKLKKLVLSAPGLFSQLEAELLAFIAFLEQ
jgi:hypothetical protein